MRTLMVLLWAALSLWLASCAARQIYELANPARGFCVSTEVPPMIPVLSASQQFTLCRNPDTGALFQPNTGAPAGAQQSLLNGPITALSNLAIPAIGAAVVAKLP